MASAQELYRLIDNYRQQPDNWSDDELLQLKALAQQQGINFSPNASLGRMAKNFGYNALDTALFGMLPKDWEPAQLTTADTIAGGIGDVAGLLATPSIVGGKIAKTAMEGFNAGEEIASLLNKGKGYASEGLSKLGTYGEKLAQNSKNSIRQAVGKSFDEALAKDLGSTEAMQMMDNALNQATTKTAFKRNIGDKIGGQVSGYLTQKLPTINPELVNTMLERGIKYGSANALGHLGDNMGESGNGLGGVVSDFFGGAGIGAISGAMASKGLAPKAIAGLIYSQMTAPDKAQYPKEAIEAYLQNVIRMGR